MVICLGTYPHSQLWLSFPRFSLPRVLLPQKQESQSEAGCALVPPALGAVPFRPYLFGFGNAHAGQEAPNGTETCSCTTIQPCERFSSTIVHRPFKCELAPCLLTMSAPNVTVAQANEPRR
jgi:hypothetical protein